MGKSWLVPSEGLPVSEKECQQATHRPGHWVLSWGQVQRALTAKEGRTALGAPGPHAAFSQTPQTGSSPGRVRTSISDHHMHMVAQCLKAVTHSALPRTGLSESWKTAASKAEKIHASHRAGVQGHLTEHSGPQQDCKGGPEPDNHGKERAWALF